MPVPRLSILSRAALFVAAFCATALPAARAAEEITLEEPATDVRVRQVSTEVRTSGRLYFNAGNNKTTQQELSAMAAFRYRERRLPPAGRDFQSLRALRDFELATMQSQVGEHATSVDLPQQLRGIVVRGGRDGIQCYCPGQLMTREAVDLLELPGDPLVLTALLPRTPVTPGAQWTAPEWCGQMLSSLEAVSKVELNCRLASSDANTAVIEFNGVANGQRYGANSDVTITGRFVFDRQQNLISKASAKYDIKSSVGLINPGIDGAIEMTMERGIAESSGRLTDPVADAIPLEPQPGDLLLKFAAPPWGVSMSFDRNWYVFQALFEGTPQVAILRLMQQGTHVCQCNLSPIAAAAPGQHTPIEQFEKDIQQALGSKFKQFTSRDRIPTDDGRTILRLVAEGTMSVAGDQGAVELPTKWIYYLCADRSGKQMSFVFVIEPAYLDMLAGRDLQMVKSVRFSR